MSAIFHCYYVKKVMVCTRSQKTPAGKRHGKRTEKEALEMKDPLYNIQYIVYISSIYSFSVYSNLYYSNYGNVLDFYRRQANDKKKCLVYLSKNGTFWYADPKMEVYAK